MAGRFMVAPFFCAVLLITRLATGTRATWAPVSIVLSAAALVTPHATLFADSRYDATEIKANGTVDERAIYFKDHSIVRSDRRTFNEPDWPHFDGRKRDPYVLSLCGLLGGAGLDWGPYTHLLDECALADPLLARLPSVWNPGWRPGHFRRLVPAGYEDSLSSGTNKIADRQLAAYYDHVRSITRAESIWSVDRLREILRFNRGKYDTLVDRPFYRYSGELVPLDAVGEPKADETPWSAPGVHDIITELAITCPDQPGHKTIDVSLDSDDTYRLYFLKRGVTISTLDLGPVPQHRRRPGLSRYTEDVPDRASRQGFDTIVVLPMKIEDHAAMGHLRLDPPR